MTNIIAHRGLSFLYPENTFSAFLACVNNKVKKVEFDIQLSKDNIPVIFHDRNLQRIAKSSATIDQSFYSDLKKLDIGSWFSPEFSDQRILDYEQFLDLFANDLFLFIEIKSYELDNSLVLNSRMKLLIEKIVHLSMQYSNLNKFCILCFEPIVLEYVKSLHSKIYTLLNLSSEKDYTNLSLVQFNGINIDINDLDYSHREIANVNKLDLFCYCCDTEEQYRKAKKLGCDYIMTNKADWLQRFISEL